MTVLGTHYASEDPPDSDFGPRYAVFFDECRKRSPEFCKETGAVVCRVQSIGHIAYCFRIGSLGILIWGHDPPEFEVAVQLRQLSTEEMHPDCDWWRGSLLCNEIIYPPGLTFAEIRELVPKAFDRAKQMIERFRMDGNLAKA